MELAEEYGRIYQRATEDPGTAGDEGEENWALLLRRWLPADYHVVTKGRILFPNRTASRQVDLVVLRGSYPPRLLDKKLYLSSGVVAAFECKNTLTAAHVRAATATAMLVKAATPRRKGTIQGELRVPIVYGLLAHSHSWKNPESAPIANIDEALGEAAKHAGHPSKLIDLICVADLAAWSLGHFVECPWFFPPEARAARLARVPEAGWILSQFTRFTEDTFGGAVETPNPVAICVAELLQWCAWEEPNLRPIADYFRVAGLMGSGVGPVIPYSLDAFSDAVRIALQTRPPTTGPDSFWDTWSMVV